ncbi:potassium channel subfamily K member 5-like isoform X2 [Syngnathoides biaculeatus]|uniref:potassium channel subfamily K member 5-like isoform X2 n=1 Tax=Syngnathoides biaculeatus TaxID=300417 RepID=UPI002ADDF590|nr:potassium channel subfamily K member 5-like isoform X2 [Syngnathoides biaculeatus]
MADQGPLLTSCIIFYLSIGAAIFQILEEPNWELARSKYVLQKEQVLKKYPCLSREDLEEILEVASEAAGQGVIITGDNHRNMWDWGNSVIFAATIVTTIGYGNVAPKTKGGRVFCILYGLCGIPLCLVWISKLGSFFGDRAKRLSEILIRKKVPVKRVQLICTVIFLLWGLFVHLVIPPFVFMSLEGWSYLEGLYFSFITLTTVGFGDYVADIEYPRLYRVFAEIWIYMGLAWLSLFFSWNVNMVVEAHKVLKKRRHKRRPFQDDEPQPGEDTPKSDTARPTVIDIFGFLSDKEEDYSTVIKEIGMAAKPSSVDVFNRSKSCSDIMTTNIEVLDHSPRHRCLLSISEVFINPKNDDCQENSTGEPAECAGTEETLKEADGTNDSPNNGITLTVPAVGGTQEGNEQPSNAVTRFTISKVEEKDVLINKDEDG